jgi:hypothetical protein
MEFRSGVDIAGTLDDGTTITYPGGTLWEMETIYKNSIGPCLEIGWDASTALGCSFSCFYAYMPASYAKYSNDLSYVLGSTPTGDMKKTSYSFLQAVISLGFCFPKK